MARTKDFEEKEVLSKAVCLFWHKGYNGTSMQELVDTLGISRSSMYETFGDKHELYIKALEYYQNNAGTELCNIISSNSSAKKAIKLMLEYIAADLLSDKQRKGCFMVNAGVELASHDPAVMKIIIRNEQTLEDAFFKALENEKKNGGLNKKQDSRALARFFFNTVKGIQVSAKSIKDKNVFRDIIDTSLMVLD